MYDPITMPVAGLTIVRILLSICALEFFGPCVRDSNRSHLLNPDWVGHARFHLMWQLGFFFFSGLGTLALIWLPDPLRPIHLYAASAWLAANFLGFWVAVVLVKAYKGLIVVPGIHQYILGVEENIFVFSALSLVFAVAMAVFALHVEPQLVAMQAAAAVAP